MRNAKRAGKTAADIVNDYEESKLADIFYLLGELKNSLMYRLCSRQSQNRKKDRDYYRLHQGSRASFQERTGEERYG